MKKILAALLAALVLFALAACNKTSETEQTPTDHPPSAELAEDSVPPASDEPSAEESNDLQTAPAVCRVKVLTNDGTELLTADYDDSQPSMGLSFVSLKTVRVYDPDGEPLSCDGILPGMVVDIQPDGTVMLPYPAQFTTEEIRVVKQENDLVGLYQRVIVELWNETTQKDGVAWLGFDFSGLTNLSQGEREALAYLAARELEMPFRYREGTWKELAASGFITEGEDGRWTDGMMLSLSLYQEEESYLGFLAASTRADGGAALVLTCMADRQEDGSWTYDTIQPSGT